MPFLLSSPSERYACVEILNCLQPSRLWMYPLLPVQPPFTHKLPSPDICSDWISVSRLWGHRCLKQPNIIWPLIKSFICDNNTRSGLKIIKGSWIASEYCFFTALLCSHHLSVYNVSDWSVVLSPQMCCVQTWRFNLIAFSPTAPVMVLRRCQVCAKCCLSSRNSQRWPWSSTTKSGGDFCKHFRHFHFWACLNLTNREIIKSTCFVIVSRLCLSICSIT